MKELENNWQDLIDRNSKAARDLGERVGFYKPQEVNIDLLSKAEKERRAKLLSLKMKREQKDREAKRKAIRDADDAKMMAQDREREAGAEKAEA